MNDSILAALRDIRSGQGDDALCDARRLASLLADMLQNRHRGERDIILKVLAEGLPQRMLRGERLDESGARFMADHVADVYFFRKDAVYEAIRCWHELFFPGALPPASGAGDGGSGRGRTAASAGAGRRKAPNPDPDLLRRAGAGDPDAQFAMGDFCAVHGDASAAAGWFRKAAEGRQRASSTHGTGQNPRSENEELADALLVLGKRAVKCFLNRK